MRIAAIVLAAGEGRRIGGPKALLRLGETTFVDHVCRGLLGCADPVIAVLGAQADEVRLGGGIPAGVVTVTNERWSEGMLSSVWRGLDEAEARAADAILLQPVDHPLVDPATVRRVTAALAGGAPIAVPTWRGRRGHPGGFAREVFALIRNASPQDGARAVLAALPEQVVHVPGDSGCVTGIDRPEDLAALSRFMKPPAGL